MTKQMNDRERLEAIIAVVCKYLPPDGTPIKDAMSEIISLVDPLPPLPVEPEPLEYWNAVEGWVKIDEVREHFDAVNCGTIYRHGGEGRVPLFTAPPQREWVGLTEEEIEVIGDKVANERLVGPVRNFRVRLARAIEQALKELNK